MSVLTCAGLITAAAVLGFLLGSLVGLTVNRWRLRRSTGRHHGRFMRGH